MSTLEVNNITPQSGTTLTLGGSGDTINLGSGVTASGFGGITEADQWVLTTNTQINGIADLTTNLARETDDSFTQIGTGMTESSGVFTFPSTGFWYISVLGALLCNNGASSFVTVRIQSTTNNSTYTTRANSYASASGANYYTHSFNEYMFNVTDVSTHKIKFNYEIGVSSRLEAGGTKFTFIRLGDAQ